MPNTEPVNWQPISEMPLIASMIDGALEDTREHMETLTKARTRPHALDDATIDRVEQVHTEQMDFVDIYTQQISRWRTETPSPSQVRELHRMETQNEQLRAVTADVLTLAAELRRGTIERVMDMTDLELGLQALLGAQPSGKR
jgi:nitrogen-specific signal transduction histidine kinase